MGGHDTRAGTIRTDTRLVQHTTHGALCSCNADRGPVDTSYSALYIEEPCSEHLLYIVGIQALLVVICATIMVKVATSSSSTSVPSVSGQVVRPHLT